MNSTMLTLSRWAVEEVEAIQVVAVAALED
jgi:hypothetical protein